MSKLWDTFREPISEEAVFVEAFTVGKDYQLDQVLLPYDIKASKAHAKGLHKINLLNDTELNNLIEGLDKILVLWQKNKFEIKREQEDGHTAIEQYLTEKYGKTGKKIHVGRSRNDQVLTALRLYEKEQLNEVLKQVRHTAYTLLEYAKKFEWWPMPGYTHMQPAMLCSVGMWAGSYAEQLCSNLNAIKYAQQQVDFCPLGTAAGFGVGLDLPREYVSEILGFTQPITVSMTAQNSRGKIESEVVHALSTITSTACQFASDLLLYTSKEYNFFSLSTFLYTGSSIMPQKKNLDIAELIRARHSEVVGSEWQLKQLTNRLTSGYQRDLQLTKEPVIQSIRTTKDILNATQLIVKHLQPNKTALHEKCYNELAAADYANKLAKKGLPFREAYQKVANELNSIKIKKEDFDTLLRSRTHLGATGNLGLDRIKKILDTV